MPTVDSPSETGLQQAPLSDNENTKLDMFFERAFEDVRELSTEATVSKVQEYSEEVRQAARVAKAQHQKEFGGSQPSSGNFGISRIRPGHFGYDSWLSCPDAQLGTATNWLHAGAPVPGATGGDPLTVGEDMVAIVLGVGSDVGRITFDDTTPAIGQELPKTEAVKFRLNDQPRTALHTWWNFRHTGTREAYFDTPMLLTEDDDFHAEFVGGEAGTEALYPIGFSFIPSKEMRPLEPADYVGTSGDNVLTY